MSGRLIYVTESGDDLDGDGSPENPFQTEDRASLDAAEGDVILVFEHVHQELPAGFAMPPLRSVRHGRRTNWAAIAAGLVGLVTGIMLRHNPSLAVFVVCTVAIITLAVLDD